MMPWSIRISPAPRCAERSGLALWELFSTHFVAEPRGLRATPRLRREDEGAGIESLGQERAHDAFDRYSGPIAMMIDSRPNGYHQIPRKFTEVILSTDGSAGSRGRARASLVSEVPSARRQWFRVAMAPLSAALYSARVSRAQRLCRKPRIAAISYQVP